jgi:hypothetical protein
LHEINQQIEDLRFERYELRAAPQLSLINIKYMIFKEKLHISSRPKTLGCFSGIIRVFAAINQASRKAFPPASLHPPFTSITMVAIDIEWRMK